MLNLSIGLWGGALGVSEGCEQNHHGDVTLPAITGLEGAWWAAGGSTVMDREEKIQRDVRRLSIDSSLDSGVPGERGWG
jgi:hypothetical protein